jgi:serine/threonine protein kinase
VPTCPTCNAALEPNARFCPKDGTTIRPDVTGEVKTKKKSTATTSSAEDPLIGRLIDGKYKVVARLGQGGVGAVYEAEHVEIGKPVAVKVLHAMFGAIDEFVKRFEREARAASKLSHPGCVQVMDFGRVEEVKPHDDKFVGMPYLVMEFVRGRLLVDRFDEQPPISPAEAARITRDVLAPLKQAHGLGIVHRDLKPGNLMLMSDPESPVRVKLLDFGLAKEMGPDSSKDAPLTQAGMVFGTPGYLSPEQAAGRPIDARADLYSLGVVLFEMACGRRPFEREDPIDVVRDHLNSAPPRPRSIAPGISDALEKVILRALEKDPAKRFADCDAFNAALAACPELSGHSTATARPSSIAQFLADPKRKRISLYAAGGVGAALLVTLVAVGLSGGKEIKASAPASTASAPSPPVIAGAGQSHLDRAADYQRKLWCSDAVSELERALRDDPGLRSDPEMARIAVRCLTPKTREKSIRFLEKLGKEALPALNEAASAEGGNAEIKRGAAEALARIR